jgi:hypothetical protein
MPTIANIEGSAFSHCAAITSITGTATRIGDGAFVYCTNLVTVNLPNAIGIGSYAFHYCINLQTFSHGNLIYVRGAAMSNCHKLTIFDIGNNSAVDFGGGVFTNDSSLIKITASFSSAPTGTYDNGSGSYGTFSGCPAAGTVTNTGSYPAADLLTFLKNNARLPLG